MVKEKYEQKYEMNEVGGVSGVGELDDVIEMNTCQNLVKVQDNECQKC